jgi:hypothetical protein
LLVLLVMLISPDGLVGVILRGRDGAASLGRSRGGPSDGDPGNQIATADSGPTGPTVPTNTREGSIR